MITIQVEILPELLAEPDGIAANGGTTREELINLALAMIVKPDRRYREQQAEQEMARANRDRATLERLWEGK